MYHFWCHPVVSAVWLPVSGYYGLAGTVLQRCLDCPLHQVRRLNRKNAEIVFGRYCYSASTSPICLNSTQKCSTMRRSCSEFEDIMFAPLNRIHERDGQTPRRSIGCAMHSVARQKQCDCDPRWSLLLYGRCEVDHKPETSQWCQCCHFLIWLCRFFRAMLCISAVYAVMRCLRDGIDRAYA